MGGHKHMRLPLFESLCSFLSFVEILCFLGHVELCYGLVMVCETMDFGILYVETMCY